MWYLILLDGTLEDTGEFEEDDDDYENGYEDEGDEEVVEEDDDVEVETVDSEEFEVTICFLTVTMDTMVFVTGWSKDLIRCHKI